MDRRRHTRVPLDFTFLVSGEGEDGRLVHVLDLSLGGLRFRSVGSRYLPDDELTARFNIDEHHFALTGRVVRALDLDDISQEVAVSFDGLDDEVKRQLRQALHNC